VEVGTIATLTLRKTFVNLVATGAAVSGQTGRDRPEDYEIPLEVRMYAGGRRRSITSAGEAGTYSFVLLLIPRTSVELLRSWQGQLVLVRDHKGRRFYGVYGKIGVTEIVSRATWNVAITLSTVTVDDGV
jgi:hypothetical protein